MKSVDLSPLNKNDTEFQKTVTELSGKYRCDWNDSVHDSFLPFVRTMEDHSQSLHRISSKAETILSDVEQINMDELCSSADNLVSEADSV